MYVEYEYYSGTFGGKLTEETFTGVEPKAEAYIRYLTFLNGDIFAESAVEAVQNAVCAAVECLALNQVTDEATGISSAVRPVRSENNDGYSVTFADASDDASAEETLRRKVLDAVRIWLLPTGWLSRRLRCGCDYECSNNSL